MIFYHGKLALANLTFGKICAQKFFYFFLSRLSTGKVLQMTRGSLLKGFNRWDKFLNKKLTNFARK
jgi:Na+/citrate or Na+/malate symporter